MVTITTLVVGFPAAKAAGNTRKQAISRNKALREEDMKYENYIPALSSACRSGKFRQTAVLG